MHFGSILSLTERKLCENWFFVQKQSFMSCVYVSAGKNVWKFNGRLLQSPTPRHSAEGDQHGKREFDASPRQTSTSCPFSSVARLPHIQHRHKAPRCLSMSIQL